ncbi:MAG: DUF1254 domain-containing protein [Candidatus Nitrosopolaris sp.]
MDLSNNNAYATNQTKNNLSNTTGATTNNNSSLLKPGNTTVNTLALDAKMLQLTFSNKPQDIATLSYIWGYPLVTVTGSFNYYTNQNPPSPGQGPANTINFARQLSNTSYVQYVSPNVNVLYGNAWLNMAKGPLVLKVPPIPDRYYVFQFMDAYGSVFAYVGARTTGSTGGTYLLTGPNWTGQVPSGMTEIKIPTNLAWISNRIQVKGPSDLANVHAIQDQVGLVPVLQGKATSPVSSYTPWYLVPSSNASKPLPSQIPALGIKVYDLIDQAMAGNPQTPPDPPLFAKFKSIGIGPGKTPSVTSNETIKKTLETGITEGEKLINTKIANIGTNVNGWNLNTDAGTYGTNYLLRAAVARYGLGANTVEEAFCTPAFTDVKGSTLTGANNYTIHFNPGQIPPVSPLGFWSVTMYNSTQRLVSNPINQYNVGEYTPGLKNNTDGSLDIYIQHQNPGQAKESNWLPSPQGSTPFNLLLRLYVPDEQAINGTRSPSPIQRTG